MTRILLTAAALITLAACAQGPDAIAPVSMPPGTYSSMSCPEAAHEAQRVSQTVASLSDQQRRAVAGDAVGVLFIGVPVASLAGGDKAGTLAAEKGKQLALDDRLRRCS